MPQFMIIPSLSCNASCKYCFGPSDNKIMNIEVLKKTISFIYELSNHQHNKNIQIVFHGGEPLVAGYSFFENALQLFGDLLGEYTVSVSIQSNLWLLSDKYCELFSKHNVKVGTSLDGPKDINDEQRGIGYFNKTISGIRKLRSWGIDTSCIVTFTPLFLNRWKEIIDFFILERLNISIHPAISTFNIPDSPYAIKPTQYSWLINNILKYYLDHRKEISILTLDQYIQGVVFGKGRVCTFENCLGKFIVIDPNADIYHCQRFLGMKSFRFGNLFKNGYNTFSELMQNDVACKLKEREEDVLKLCKNCQHFDYCKGGCPYNAWSRGNFSVLDPLCESYKDIFNNIQSLLFDGMIDEKVNINQSKSNNTHFNDTHSLLELCDPIHPSIIAQNARRIVAAVELAKGTNIKKAAIRLKKLGICRTQESAELSLNNLRYYLHNYVRMHNNLYLHITYQCQLECTHCYIENKIAGQNDMDLKCIKILISEAKRIRFRQVIITGGEPLLFNNRDEMFKTIAKLKNMTHPMKIVLRTNFSIPLNKRIITLIAESVDYIVVSVDGDKFTHENRRGPNTYEKVINNLNLYIELANANKNFADISLSSVLTIKEITGIPGRDVRSLAEKLGINRVRFRPVLPLGKAKQFQNVLSPEPINFHLEPFEIIKKGFHPVINCGFGQNLYVAPSGDAFPCYANNKPKSYLGNVFDQSLLSVIDSIKFRQLQNKTVDSIPNCRLCETRYLCGGLCNAWGYYSYEDEGKGFSKCVKLKNRTEDIYLAACNYLNI